MALLPKLVDLLGKQSNREGAISDAIARYQKDRERVEQIETELRTLKADRERIDIRIHELENERTAILGVSHRNRDEPEAASTPSNVYKRSASPHILRLLKEREGLSRAQAVHRKWLDEQLINKVEGIHNSKPLVGV